VCRRRDGHAHHSNEEIRDGSGDCTCNTDPDHRVDRNAERAFVIAFHRSFAHRDTHGIADQCSGGAPDFVSPDCYSNCPPNVYGSGVPSGAFHVAKGRIIGPNGLPFIARGINMADSDMGDAAAAIALFPGLNFVRLAIYTYQDPSAYAAFISTMTSRGTVVEIEHHVETDGNTGGGGTGNIASGAWLAAENAFYAAVAGAYASNPYVWFGTTNEPPDGSDYHNGNSPLTNLSEGKEIITQLCWRLAAGPVIGQVTLTRQSTRK
jgi:hypothetical protein